MVAPVVSADPLVAHARQLAKSGDNGEAAQLFSAWLAANAGASGSAAVFAEYMNLEQNLPALFDASGRFLQSGKGVPGAAVQFERIARLFDLAGRIEEARNAYVAAHVEGAPDSTLVSAFLLSLQMNDADAMSASIEQMQGRGESMELFLRALSMVRAGNPAAARTALIGLADQTGNPDISLKALWILYQAARSGGDSAGQSALRAKLGSRFSAAPETALAAGPSPVGAGPRATVVQMPAPGPFETGSVPAAAAEGPAAASESAPAAVEGPAVAAESVPAARPAPPSSPLMSVQAGSFVMKENADDLVLELGKRGFTAVVTHEVVQGRDRYKVFAGTGLLVDAAKEILKKLSEAGFSGFILQEK
jgi:cell division septation protein DedD